MAAVGGSGSVSEKIATAEAAKAAGNELFQAGDAQGALQQYYTGMFAVKGLEGSSMLAALGGTAAEPGSAGEQATAKALLISIYCNMSACMTKLGKAKRAIAFARDALKLDEGHGKAHLRLGMAYEENGNYDGAYAAYTTGAAAADAVGDAAGKASLDKRAARAAKIIEKEKKKANNRLRGFLTNS
ncbi:uncharacterized protein AMSG_07059 [Thecamonas trahens ATCC 50062]|uniref:peptidylprolyl isomerase n=1 Tax=Thecamonas trahens ATCC 50062 TaxID=461836 RepID=A0A0L0DFX2_THETB|nr:hypothetical protein AMSG_07059 [Thecamonas trahens ATCC 50062]KNC51070.1 hypothetical protein AMSG_07059 [Thecamonas trahens ATCC 50062]|eukprot:XP_013756529.1 hypothetical protein AMSG_07059 [Thecamonas trahens ATCC 50062]